MKNRIITVIGALALAATVQAQTWIWYPGDYEVWLGNKMNNRRTDRGAFFPPFWKSDSHFVTVEFSKKVDIKAPETIKIATEGTYNVKLDGKMAFGMPSEFTIPAGRHSINIKIWNQVSPPALYVNGETIKSDGTWKVTNEDKEWIDASGKASDTSASIYMDAGSWNFDSVDKKPSQFKLNRTPMQSVSRKNVGKGVLYDFGKETFGYLDFHGLTGKGDVNIFYGESAEEAQDEQHCETLDKLNVGNGIITDLSTNLTAREGDYTMNNCKAFRYVYVTKDDGVNINDMGMQYEYSDEKVRASFKCNDEEVNKMWQIGEYTLHLTTREFFIDGIKRDRWTWSGDAYQSYLMNYYLYFDDACVRRTAWQLRGKDPVTAHINTIMDYTFYWFLGIYDYYMYTGDSHFVNQIYPRMQSMMDYVLGRTDKNGMVEGLSGDWVFVDWADGPMDKHGELAFEQVLFCKSLETMALCAKLANNQNDESKYSKLASELKSKLLPTFWDESRKALVHNVVDGKQSEQITRYANMFAIFYDYLSPEQKQEVAKSVIHNDSIMKITTPYMRFYELESLCNLGEQSDVMKQMKAYWGGMIREGATTFWEKYNPSEHGSQHLAMYGRPYGKSLCHAWGASPIYLLGKYYLGVRPVKPGYAEFAVTPVLGGLKWMDGSVPTPHGDVHVYMDGKTIKVKATEGKGYLYLSAKKMPKASQGTMEKLSDGKYRVWIDTKDEVTVQY
jgi:alpha-L-rhamnosidase